MHPIIPISVRGLFDAPGSEMLSGKYQLMKSDFLKEPSEHKFPFMQGGSISQSFPYHFYIKTWFYLPSIKKNHYKKTLFKTLSYSDFFSVEKRNHLYVDMRSEQFVRVFFQIFPACPANPTELLWERNIFRFAVNTWQVVVPMHSYVGINRNGSMLFVERFSITID